MPARAAGVTVAALILSTASAVAGAASASAVGAPTQQPTLVATTPSNATPNILDGVVYAITKVGNDIVVGGSFTTAQNRTSSTTISQPYLLAFDASTGTVSTTFTPVVDNKVMALLPGPTAHSVYVGGYFSTVNGAKARKLALVDTQTGQLVPGFTPPAFDGAVQSLGQANGELLVGGNFTTAALQPRSGLASVNPTTGALDSYLQVQLAGHHNYNGSSGAVGPVGARSLAVSPDGRRLVVLGNFRTADGLSRDQMAMIDLGATSAAVDPSWATQRYTAKCSTNFDSYVSDVQWAPDGSYFVTDATGGGGPNSLNSDGTRSLCDAAARWNAGDSGSDVAPAWIDYTGNDTLLSVAVTGTAVYVGGHERWLNNPSGSDKAAQGATPRPGIAALDPANGLPLAWNPGRNPRGKGAYALYAADNGVYVGSDTDYIGDFAFKRQRVAFFPLAGGAAPDSTSVAALPANVYLGGALSGTGGHNASDALTYRPVSQTQVGATSTAPSTTLAWSAVHGAFVVGTTLFFGQNGALYKASFDGTTIGTPTAVDPYHDPAWSSVPTGSGQTYVGVTVGYYSELPTVTGAFYADGKIFYTIAGSGSLYWRYFSPDSGIVGGQEFSTSVPQLKGATGLFASGSTLYYADGRTGALHELPFAGDVPNPGGDTVVDTGNSWSANNLFLFGTADF